MSSKSMDVTHLLAVRKSLCSLVSILNVSVFRYLFSKLRSRIGLYWLLGFGTKKSILKKARDV